MTIAIITVYMIILIIVTILALDITPQRTQLCVCACVYRLLNPTLSLVVYAQTAFKIRTLNHFLPCSVTVAQPGRDRTRDPNSRGKTRTSFRLPIMTHYHFVPVGGGVSHLLTHCHFVPVGGGVSHLLTHCLFVPVGGGVSHLLTHCPFIPVGGDVPSPPDALPVCSYRERCSSPSWRTVHLFL